MANEAERIAGELRKRKGAVLVDVQVQGTGRAPPDSVGFAIVSAAAKGDRLIVQLAWADEPRTAARELVVEGPAGFKQHPSGVWDIASARAVTLDGETESKQFDDSLAARFLFK